MSGRPSAMPESPHMTLKRSMFGGLLFLLVLVFSALGTWQVQRLFWKLDLIARVDARVHAEPAPPPAKAAWAGINAASDEYRRIKVEGNFLNDRETLVQAVTELGAGYWVITPLATADGSVILVNRGFVPADRRDPAKRTEGQVSQPTSITGLMRMTEPGGAFLRSNDPAADKWYSRDVAAIAASRHLDNVAPYFIDADKTPNKGGYPVGGLTVVHFRNSHLVYAITWYGLAVMAVVAGVMLFRRKRMA
jgi:surfeit locus 1 family protein